jgi:arylsulfatase A-like enzyme
VVAEVFWQSTEDEDPVRLASLRWEAAPEGGKLDWRPLDLDLPEGAGRLSLATRFEDPGLAMEAGPDVAWELPALLTPRAGAPDILLISIDTLRADGLARMPYLRGLLAEGWSWREAISPSNWTLPAMASLLTGRDPGEHGSGRGPFTPEPSGESEERGFGSLDEDLPTLGSLLAAEGYRTAMWHQNPFLEDWSGLARGFDRYVRTRDEPRAPFPGLTQWWTRHQGQPRFAVLHEFTPHLPYAADWDEVPDPLAELPLKAWFAADLDPAERRRRFELPTEAQAQVRARYEHQLAELDRALEEVVATIRADAPDLLVLVHVDHGEVLWDDGSFEHGFSFDDSVVQVPLGLSWRGEIPPAEVDGPVAAHHLGRLLCELLRTRRGIELARMPPSHLLSADGRRPLGGTAPVETVAPLYRSETGGRRWTPEGGWTTLPFDPRGTAREKAWLPTDTARRLVELGYAGD